MASRDRRAGGGARRRWGSRLIGCGWGLCSLVVLAGCIGDPPGLTKEQEAELAKYVSAAPPEGLTKADVDFDGKVRLVGYAIAPKQAQYPPGTDVTVTLAWRCDAKLEAGYQLFTHLVGQGGARLDNVDDRGPLRKMAGVEGQPLPPSRWEPGKYYKDEISFKIPADPSPVVIVAAGIYKGNARLPIKGPGGDKESRTSVVRLATGARNTSAVLKELDVVKLAPGTSIAIDGKLDEPAWGSAAKAGPFVDVGSGRESPGAPSQGSARLLWDDEHLYVGFEVSDKTVRGGWPEGAKDPHLWEKDTVEIMADPDGDGDNKDYYEIQINPQNLVFDTQYDDYNFPNGNGKGPFGHEEWSARLTSAVTVHGTMDDDKDQDQGYTVEAKIPWSSFSKAKRVPPGPGDVWRMNFYAMQNNGGTAWSPILGQGNFHRASRFGRVRFTAPAAAAPPVTSGSASAQASASAGASASASASAGPAPKPKP